MSRKRERSPAGQSSEIILVKRPRLHRPAVPSLPAARGVAAATWDTCVTQPAPLVRYKVFLDEVPDESWWDQILEVEKAFQATTRLNINKSRRITGPIAHIRRKDKKTFAIFSQARQHAQKVLDEQMVPRNTRPATLAF